MKKIMTVREITLNNLYEITDRHGITYRVAASDNGGTAFLFDNNNASGKWYLLDIGSVESMKDKANRLCHR